MLRIALALVTAFGIDVAAHAHFAAVAAAAKDQPDYPV